jgi:hypothetical protein
MSVAHLLTSSAIYFLCLILSNTKAERDNLPLPSRFTIFASLLETSATTGTIGYARFVGFVKAEDFVFEVLPFEDPEVYATNISKTVGAAVVQ